MEKKSRGKYLIIIPLLVVAILIYKPKLEEYKIKNDIKTYITKNESEIKSLASEALNNGSDISTDEYILSNVEKEQGIVEFKYIKSDKPDAEYGFFYMESVGRNEVKNFFENTSSKIFTDTIHDNKDYYYQIRKITDNTYLYKISK